MKRTARSILLLVLVGCLSGIGPIRADPQDSPTKALEWQLVEAESALDQGEPRIAESYYRGALRELWALRGELAAGAGDLETAEQALLKARAASAVGVDSVRIELAEIQLHLGKLDEPLKELRLLAHQRTEDPELLESFIRGLIQAEKTDELSVELEQMARLDPDRAHALRQLDAGGALRPISGNLGLDADGQPVAGAGHGALGPRLIATLHRVEHNLGVLQAWTGFENTPVAEADAPPPRPTDGAEPFGTVELRADVGSERVALPTMDPVGLTPLFPDTFLEIFVALDAGDTATALADLERRVDEGDADAMTLSGWIAASEGRAADAERTLLEAVASHPKPLLARQVLARMYWHTDRRAAAKEHVLQAAELGALDRDLSLWLADVEIADGRIPAANRQLRSLDRRFESVEALVRLADIFVGLNNSKAAMDYLEKARGLAPSSEEVLVLHAELALDIGVIPVAAASVEPLARMRPDVARYQLYLGRVWAGLGKMGEASEALLRSVALDPELKEAFLPLGLALNHESRFEQAGDYLRRYLESFPDDLEATAGLAEAEQRLGESESAESRVRWVLERDPEHGRANLVLGLLLLGREELTEARTAFERAVSADPLSAKAHYQLSLVCTRLRDRACASEHLKKYKNALKGPESTFQTMESKAVELELQKQEDPRP